MRFRPTLLVLSCLVGLACSRPAGAQTLQAYAETSYLEEYERHAHGYGDDVVVVPRFDTPGPWAALRPILLGGRRASSLYLLGDDRLHLFPTRLGVLGWGLHAGLEF